MRTCQYYRSYCGAPARWFIHLANGSKEDLCNDHANAWRGRGFVVIPIIELKTDLDGATIGIPERVDGKPRKFYIASGKDQIELVRSLASDFIRRGWSWSFNWIAHLDHVCSSFCGVNGRAALAMNELLGAKNCDLFIGIARLGKGSHVELGAALMGNARIILVGCDPVESVFYCATDVEHCKTVDEALARFAK